MIVMINEVEEVETFDIGEAISLIFKRTPDDRFKLRYRNNDSGAQAVCKRCGEKINKKQRHRCGDYTYYTEDEMKDFIQNRFNSNLNSVMVINGITVQHKLA